MSSSIEIDKSSNSRWGKKTLIIGLDAAAWRIIQPMVKKDELPNIGALIKKGVSGILKSTTPPMTPLAWPSIITGVNPGKHGIFDFVELDRKNYKVSPVNFFPRLKKPAIWEIFNEYNKKVGIFNFPMAYPPAPVKSFFVSGAFSPKSNNLASPPELNKYIKSRGYQISPSCVPEDGIDAYYDEVIQITDRQCNIALELFGKYEWEMFFMVFQGLDWLQHYLWGWEINNKNAINQAYRHIDTVIGRLIKEAGEDWNIIILSDHGFNQAKAEVHLNNLLEKWGYLKRLESKRYKKLDIEEYVFTIARNIFSRVPPSLKRRYKSYLSESMLNKIRVLQSEHYQLNLIDWSQTRAFSYGYMGRIFIHTKDDYLRGIVRRGREYHSVREGLIEHLNELQNPINGERIVGEVFKKEDIYTGDQLQYAPDIIFNTSDFSYIVYGDFGETWINELEVRLADHDMNGIFILKGPGIKEGFRRRADIVDITPTILYLHDLPIAEYMDGEVLQDIFKDELITGRKIRRINNSKGINQSKKYQYTQSEEKEIINQLKNMGYI